MKCRTLVMIIIVACSAAGCRGAAPEGSESAASSTSVAPRTPSTEYPRPGEGNAGSGSGDEAAVRRAVQEIYEVDRRCWADYPLCDESAFETVLTGAALQSFTVRTATDQAANKTTTGAETLQFAFEHISAQEDSALVMGCTSNHIILYNPDGSVDDDSFWSAKGMWWMDLVDGKWLGKEFWVLESATGVDNDLCGGLFGRA